jgi:competence protein ComEA
MVSFPHTLGRRRAVVAGVVGLLLVAFAVRHLPHGVSAASGSALQVAPLAGTDASPIVAPAGAAGGRLVVDVVGAVRRPGVYRLGGGARVEDAVARAGGLTRRADPLGVNLAAPLVDGEQVVVSIRGSAGAPGGAAGAAGAPVSLSTATVEQLDALPGIGPVTAQKIVDYRGQHGGFTSVDGLDAIPGIGPAKIADLQGLVVP